MRQVRLRPRLGNARWAICPKQLGVLTTNAFLAIRDGDPSARVVAGNVLFHGDDGWVAKEYWKQVAESPAVTWHVKNRGGRRPWDEVGIHPYGYKASDGTLEAQIESVRGFLAGYGDPAPVVLTEYGWTTDRGPGVARASEVEQASLLEGTYATAKSLGVPYVMWFNYQSTDEDFGMRRPDAAKSWKPAGRAYCRAANATACPAP